ncbi:MAG: hypothetical protein Fur0022_11590 [Anaerolineales bacterium]
MLNSEVLFLSNTKVIRIFGADHSFYSNEHEPIHVHRKYQDTETKTELIIDNGQIVEIRFSPVRGRKPLDRNKLNDFRVIVAHYAENIVQKRIDYFVLHRPIEIRTDYLQDSMTDVENEIIEIVSVKHEGDYRLPFSLVIDKDRVMDFAPFLRGSLSPLIRK